MKTKEPSLEDKTKTNVVSVENVDKINDYKTNDFSTDPNTVLLARMIYGEARGCSDQEKIYLGFTPINRSNDRKKWNGETIEQAILKPNQYSSFNQGDVNLHKLKDPNKYEPKAFENCLKLAKGILNGKYDEFNYGQTHFHNSKTSNPKWVKSNKMKRLKQITGTAHSFYLEK